MKLLILVFFCACRFVANLNVRTPNRSTQGTHYVPKSEEGSLASGNSTNANPLLSFDVATNFSCGGAECRFKSVHSLSAKLVWFLGCSLDSQAVMYTCLSNGAQVFPYNHADDPLFKYCTVNGFTLVFTFHPGATPPPYYDFYKFDTTTQNIVQTSLLRIQQIFGKVPDATIVDSSLWDVANWWKKNGAPQNWPVPNAEILQWCSHTVPTFLDFVKATVPSTHLAFRTPPPVFPGCEPGFEFICKGPQIIQNMYGCLLKSTNTVTHQLYSKYPAIDYHQIVISTGSALGGDLRALYSDTIHPGRELALAYMSVVLNWVNGL